MISAVFLLSAVTAERLAELWLAKRNTCRLIAAGAVEVSPGHYPLIVLLHAAWLTGLWLMGWDLPLHIGWLAIFACLQVLRVWTLCTLGMRWTTRIIVLPGAPLVKTGPYRFISHPNYLVVVGEIATLPLTFGLTHYALTFTILNAIVLSVRIRAETVALGKSIHGAL
jgi:methyltransferase